jgi:hypothetical protein
VIFLARLGERTGLIPVEAAGCNTDKVKAGFSHFHHPTRQVVWLRRLLTSMTVGVEVYCQQLSIQIPFPRGLINPPYVAYKPVGVYRTRQTPKDTLRPTLV